MTKAVVKKIVTRLSNEKLKVNKAKKLVAKQQMTPGEKKVSATTLQMIVETIYKEKNHNAKRLPRNFIKDLVNDYKHLIPNLDEKMIKNAYNYKLLVLKKRSINKQVITTPVVDQPSDIVQAPVDTVSVVSIAQTNESVSSLSNSQLSSLGSSQDTSSTFNRPQPGRPKGTTILECQKLFRLRVDFINEVAYRYCNVKLRSC